MATSPTYYWRTRAGTFVIRPARNGWGVWCDNELLHDGYPSAQHACDDVAGGHTTWPGGVDPSTLGLPDEVGAWERAR